MSDPFLKAVALFVFILITVELIIPSQTARLYRVASGREFRPSFTRHSMREVLQKLPAYFAVGYLSYKTSINLVAWILPLIAVFVVISSLNVYFRVLRPMFDDAKLRTG